MTELRFDNQVAIVTGAGRGMGRAHALLLAARGALVVVNDPGVDLRGNGSDKGPADEVVAEIIARGGKAVASFDSVATAEGCSAIVAKALDSFGGVHIIVNNAGNFVDSRPFLETSSESFESLFQVHVMGAVNIIRAAWPHMVAQSYGRIINIGSHGGYYGHGGKFEYAVAKGAIHGLTMTLAMEGKDHGITANVVAPGASTRPVLSWAKPGMFDGPAFSADLVSPTVVWLAHADCKANGESFGAIAGSTTRIVIAETKGYQVRQPTPEAIRDHFAQIEDAGEQACSGHLVFPEGAIPRGAQLVAQFDLLPED